MLPVSSLTGTLLSGVFNYQEAPTIGQTIAWVAFLVITLFLFLRPARQSAPQPIASPARKPSDVRA